MTGAYLVVRVKGQADVPHWAQTTMRLLKLEKKHRATIIPATDTAAGMLKKIQTFVSWTDAQPAIVQELLQKKARKSGYKKVDASDLPEMGYDSMESLAASLSDGKISLSKVPLLKPWFALSPPRSGYKRSTKRLAGQRGVLGKYDGLSDMVRRMV